MMAALRNYLAESWKAWNRFWFAPANPATLSAIRVLAGAMLLYTHLVWSLGLTDFFGPNGWLPQPLMSEFRMTNGDPDGPGPVAGLEGRFIWSHFHHVDSPKLIWTVHVVALVVFFLLTIGFFSRAMAVLAFLFAVSYANRITPGAYFGLDKVNCMLALYLMLGPCGARYSVDRLWRLHRGHTEISISSMANLAIRLIQVHVCIIYLFSAIVKLRGSQWLGGEAVWMAFGMYESQSLDMTWLASWPLLLNLLTYLTLFWELAYCALIWPALSRPWMLLMAIFVHSGVVLALGMPTFGLAMLIGNLAFVSPETVRKVFDPIARRISLAVVGKATGGATA